MIEHILRKVRRVLYLFAYFPLYILCKIFFRLNVQGKENLPRSKQLLIVARHDSYWDPPLIGVAVGPGYTVHFIARKSLLNNPLLALPVKIFTTTISRDNFGKADLRKMLTALKEEETICILPEGTTRETRRPKRGAVKLAERTGKAFLPVNISSPHYPPEFPHLFPQITVNIGRPFTVEDLKEELENSQDLRSDKYYDLLSNRMMARIDEASR